MEDKIFNNNYGSQEIDGRKINFKIDTSMLNEKNIEEDIYFKEIYDKIHNIIQNSEYNKLNLTTKDGIKDKIKKNKMNDIYSFVISKLDNEYPHMDIFYCVTDYFNINEKRFYSCISNTFKQKLLEELEKKIDINKNKLF